MLKSKLRNKYWKIWRGKVTIQKTNKCLCFLLKKAKKEYYENLDLHNVTDKEVLENSKTSIRKQSQDM